MYEIEKGVPMPEMKNVGYRSKYPWKAMEIGDSFFIPAPAPVALRGNLCKVALQTGKRFTARDAGNGFRVWRVA